MILRFLSIFFCFASLWGKEAPIDRLMAGNQRYVKDSLQHPHRNLERRQALLTKQEPFGVIVSCSDSRVPPEIIFDQGLGDLFIVRVAGNVIGPLGLDSIEYAVLHLGSSVILVLGHENCGAVDAVIQGTTTDIEEVAILIEPAVKQTREKRPKNLLEASVKANALRMRDYLLKTQVVSQKKVAVYAGYYDLETGKVELLNP